MGLRAYLLVNVVDDMEQQEFIKVLRQLEEMPGVDFVDPVIGSRDMIILVDSPTTVEALASKIRAKGWIKDMDILRIVSMSERHRASKKELLKALTRSGV
jgi:DNA-binding Lrp family transcriptional regulator